MPASEFVSQSGVQTAPCSEGGDCIGGMNPGEGLCYESVNSGGGVKELELRAAALRASGLVEVRLESPPGRSAGDDRGWPHGRLAGVADVFRPAQAGERTEKCLLGIPQANSGVGPNDGHSHEPLVCASRRAAHHPLGPVSRGRSQRTPSGDQRASDGVLPGPTRSELDCRAGFVLEQAAAPQTPPTAKQIGVNRHAWERRPDHREQGRPLFGMGRDFAGKVRR